MIKYFYLILLITGCSPILSPVIETARAKLAAPVANWTTQNEVSITQYELQSTQDTVKGIITTVTILKKGKTAYSYTLGLNHSFYRVKGTGHAVFYTAWKEVSGMNSVGITYPNYTSTLLSWRSSNEVNVTAFLIERSQDGKSWASFTTINDKGNTSYSLRISKTSIRYTYRVSAVYYDGTKSAPAIFK